MEETYDIVAVKNNEIVVIIKRSLNKTRAEHALHKAQEALECSTSDEYQVYVLRAGLAKIGAIIKK